jgi:hypothetical protein
MTLLRVFMITSGVRWVAEPSVDDGHKRFSKVPPLIVTTGCFGVKHAPTDDPHRNVCVE